MASMMFSKYNKYWGDYAKINSALFFAQLLDPREKERGLEYHLECLYEKDTLKVAYVMRKVKADFMLLFEEYKSMHSNGHEGSSSSTSVFSMADSAVSMQEQSFLSRIKSGKKRHKKNPSGSGVETTIELDRYLMDVMDLSESEGEEVDSSFDILVWWQNNISRYKILSYMTKDILPMHVTSVASESAFSTGKRVLNPWRSSLSTRTVEALLYTQSWLLKPVALDLLYDYIPDDNSNVEEELLGPMPPPESFDP